MDDSWADAFKKMDVRPSSDDERNNILRFFANASKDLGLETKEDWTQSIKTINFIIQCGKNRSDNVQNINIGSGSIRDSHQSESGSNNFKKNPNFWTDNQQNIQNLFDPPTKERHHNPKPKLCRKCNANEADFCEKCVVQRMCQYRQALSYILEGLQFCEKHFIIIKPLLENDVNLLHELLD